MWARSEVGDLSAKVRLLRSLWAWRWWRLFWKEEGRGNIPGRAWLVSFRTREMLGILPGGLLLPTGSCI